MNRDRPEWFEASPPDFCPAGSLFCSPVAGIGSPEQGANPMDAAMS
ncbi:MAG TPA: hypothetical protein VG756_16855 [Pseudonocardiaceae bacterium]|nr:hypothetical protein [Pseudonocardiaceae bacterium]